MTDTAAADEVKAAAIRTGGAAPAPPPAPKVRLGEELPLFCERCGYALHGMPPTRCAHCDVLHFQCPECGHHQPVNTLRPAMQRFLGRVRVLGLVTSVFLKINYFGWLLFAWFAMGVEWRPRAGPTLEMLIAFALFGLPFGVVSRLLLLRWRSTASVALVLATLAGAAAAGGIAFRRWEEQFYYGARAEVPVWSVDDSMVALMTFGWVALGVLVAVPTWRALANLFLPRDAARTLLAWQAAQSGGSIERRGSVQP